jgi:hypothetical protein
MSARTGNRPETFGADHETSGVDHEVMGTCRILAGRGFTAEVAATAATFGTALLESVPVRAGEAS